MLCYVIIKQAACSFPSSLYFNSCLKWNFIMEFPESLLIGTYCCFLRATYQLLHLKLTTEAANEASPKEDKNGANKKKKKEYAAERNNKPTSAERKISEIKDLTSGTDSKKKEVKKSKMCSIL